MNTDNMIFTFGSNLAGRHGGGAARYAHEKRGAIYGKALGFQGQSYAIPTKNYDVRSTLPLSSILIYVKNFKREAAANDHLQFQVTCIGCGLAGLAHQDIAPMFTGSPKNCHFDTLWKPWLGDDVTYWGTY